MEKPLCLVQGKGPDAFFPEDGGRNQKGRVSAAPSALQGIIQDAAQDQPPLVPLAGSGKAFAEITPAIFRSDGTDLFPCQLRAFFHHPGGHIADFLQRAGTAVFPCFQAGADSLGKRYAFFPASPPSRMQRLARVILSPLPRLVSRRSFKRRKASMGGMPRERMRKIPAWSASVGKEEVGMFMKNVVTEDSQSVHKSKMC